MKVYALCYSLSFNPSFLDSDDFRYVTQPLVHASVHVNIIKFAPEIYNCYNYSMVYVCTKGLRATCAKITMIRFTDTMRLLIIIKFTGGGRR